MRMRIATGDLRLGMYVHAMEGSWFAHPFWRRRFLLNDPADLAALRESDTRFVVIDGEKGLLPQAEPMLAEPVDAAPPPLPPLPPLPAIAKAGRKARDRVAAQKVMDRSKTIMRGVFDRAVLGDRVRAEQIESVVDEISEAMDRNRKALTGLLRLKSKDEYTYVHSVAVCALMIGLARQLGMDERTVRDLGMAGLLHDIGKLKIAEAILNKPGRLTDAEFLEVRSHPERGAEIILRGEGIPPVAIDVCRHHHEKFDGTGYPDRLAGAAIALSARMGAICDVYDALTSNRAYKNAWTPIEALAAMESWPGHFDPDLLFAFYRSLSLYPPGLMLRTADRRLGLVMPAEPRAAASRLRLFYDCSQGDVVVPEDVTLSGPSDPAIAARETPAGLGVGDWEAFADYLRARGSGADLATLRYHWRRPRASTPQDEPAEPALSARPWQPADLG